MLLTANDRNWIKIRLRKKRMYWLIWLRNLVVDWDVRQNCVQAHGYSWTLYGPLISVSVHKKSVSLVFSRLRAHYLRQLEIKNIRGIREISSSTCHILSLWEGFWWALLGCLMQQWLSICLRPGTHVYFQGGYYPMEVSGKVYCAYTNKQINEAMIIYYSYIE